MLGTTTFAFVASEVSFIKFIGIGIAISVFIDATVVRMLLVPAFLVVMGDWNWYCPYYLGKAVDYLGVSDDHVKLENFSLPGVDGSGKREGEGEGESSELSVEKL